MNILDFDSLKRTGKSGVIYVVQFLKWLIVSAIIGTIGGLVGGIFHHCIEEVSHFRNINPWMLYFLPVGGVIIVFLYQKSKMENDRGTNTVLDAVRTETKVPFLMAPLIFIGTVITHLLGGSAGREGAALQIGGSIGYNLGNVLNFDEKDKHIMVMCGMSAVFSAMFGTPLTATIFSMEVVAVGLIYYSAFVPCIISATVAYGIVQKLGITGTQYNINLHYELSVGMVTRVIGLAIICGIVSIFFCMMLHETSRLFKKWFPNAYARIIVGAILIIILTLLVGNQSYNGAGMNLIYDALHTRVPSETFLMKILFTAITIGVGFRGGEIVPTLVIGSSLGGIVGPLLGLESGFAAAIGMISLFCSVVNAPLSAIMLSIEMFGEYDILLFGVACGVSYVFSGYYGLYSSQKIMYGKIKSEFIDRETH